VRLLLVALLVAAVALPAVPAGGDPRPEAPPRALCAPGVRHHGAAIDLDLKAAGIHDVFRLLADVGHVNLVVSDDVTGTVTLRLARVPWDAAACAIAGLHRLTIEVQGSILVVMRRRAASLAAPPRPEAGAAWGIL
jgi:type IV pilus assembly protein PilQ